MGDPVSLPLGGGCNSSINHEAVELCRPSLSSLSLFLSGTLPGDQFYICNWCVFVYMRAR